MANILGKYGSIIMSNFYKRKKSFSNLYTFSCHYHSAILPPDSGLQCQCLVLTVSESNTNTTISTTTGSMSTLGPGYRSSQFLDNFYSNYDRSHCTDGLKWWTNKDTLELHLFDILKLDLSRNAPIRILYFHILRV